MDAVAAADSPLVRAASPIAVAAGPGVGWPKPTGWRDNGNAGMVLLRGTNTSGGTEYDTFWLTSTGD